MLVYILTHICQLKKNVYDNEQRTLSGYETREVEFNILTSIAHFVNELPYTIKDTKVLLLYYMYMYVYCACLPAYV